MPDTLGRISVPSPTASGLTFPLVSDFGYGMTRDWSIIEHPFGSGATLQSQRFSSGSGLRRFFFVRSALSFSDRKVLIDFFNSVKGPLHSFIYNSPNPNSATTTDYPVIFDTAPISIEHLASMCRTGLTFLEIVDAASAPIYNVSSISTRFPSAGLSTSLLSETQIVIPLFKIQVRDPAVPPIYLSDRRVTVGSRHYLPRVLSIGEAGSDVIMTQDISGKADNLQFTLGNGDRAMSLLVKDTSLKFATVEFSLFFLTSLTSGSSGTQVDLWKGSLIDWKLDGSPLFHIFCSDILYPLTQSYPRRVVSRQCWKTFNDHVKCDFDRLGAHGSALTALGGSPTSCDFFFNSPNGCLAHGMSPSFGGHPVIPQPVVIKDNGTGSRVFGGRDVVTSTSTIADNIWGFPLPEIWCNDDGDPGKAFIASALVIATRDESTFQDVLGIVGAGPLGAFTGMSVQTNADGYKFIVSPLADGVPPQGFKVDSNLVITGYHPELGLRENIGEDPANPFQQYFSLGQGTPQHWDIPDPVFGNILTNQPRNILPFAAGTALCEVRYPKSPGSGITPTTAESHTLSVPISRGLTGISAADGSTTPGLTNPFWIAVNSILRALGVDREAPITQRDYYLPESLYTGSGTGCAEIADLVVPKLLGTGTEKQFRFQGAIGLGEFKPFRDWLTEILSCCLGYFTFEFGRLRLGIRSNASAVSAFTIANMLYQSLEIQPTEAAFEYLKLDFANQDIQYQMDMAEYNDKDHARYYGRPDAPLTSRMRSPGVSTMSQALRIAATRVREEIGGIRRNDLTNPYMEWDNANYISFKTTVLALETAAGQVISVTHPDIPTYPGPVGGSASPANTWKYRIQRWTLHKDWSVSISARSVTDSMYSLDVGPKPGDVKPSALPILHHPQSSLPAWAPDAISADAADALFPSERTFDLPQSYTTLDDGSIAALAVVTGKIPVTIPFLNSSIPNITLGKITQSTTGGSIPGGISLRIILCASNGIGGFSGPSKVLIVHVPSGTNTNSITISGILWGPYSNMGFATAFYSTEDALICGQQSFVLSFSGGVYTTTAVTLTANPLRSTYAVPNPATRKIRVRACNLVHGGVVGSVVTAISGSSVTASGIIDVTATDDWTGRVFAIIGRDSAGAPYFSATITAWNPLTGVFTLDRDAEAAGVLSGDAFVVCFLGYDNGAGFYGFGDAGLINSTNPVPFTGETPDDPNRIGNVVYVLKGKSRGFSAKIISNSASGYSFDQPLPLDTTSVVIVISGNWQDSFSDSAVVANADNSAFTAIPLSLNNLGGISVLIAVFTVDINDVESGFESAPVRMLYMFGAPGSNSGRADGYVTLVIASNQVTPDLSLGLNFKLTLISGTQVTINDPIRTGSTITSGAWMALYIFQDGTGNRPIPAFGPAFGSDVSGAVLMQDANTRSCLIMTFHPDNLWHLDSITTGLPVT